MSKGFTDFVVAHRTDDTRRLMLSADRYRDIDVAAAVQQIEGWQTARYKWPRLAECIGVCYPPRLNREQASSEATARYKASLVSRLPHGHVADLTGGMGIDSMAMASLGGLVDYVEREEMLCELMQHNTALLGLANVHVHQADCEQWVAKVDGKVDGLFIDPARRDDVGRRVVAFECCTPDVVALSPLLLSRAQWLLVKASPMVDIDRAVSQLANVAEVHVVSVSGECKEILFLCMAEAEGEAQIHAVDLSAEGKRVTGLFPPFRRSDESATACPYAPAVSSYLYEPAPALMKSGPFGLIAKHYGLAGLAPNSHLYTSAVLVEHFPGRTFEVLQHIKLSRRAVAQAIPQGAAHVVVRNYPVAAATLQRQLGLREGGDLYIVATTVAAQRCGLLCRRLY